MRTLGVWLLFLFLGYTNTVHVSPKADPIYSHHSTIAVSCNSDDPLSIQQTLEQVLMSKGFNVVPERRATIKANIQNSQYTIVASEEGISSERSKKMHPIYILHFSYDYDPMTSYRDYIFKNFSASLVDLENGDVVASADFSQGSFGAETILSVLDDFVKKLNKLS